MNQIVATDRENHRPSNPLVRGASLIKDVSRLLGIPPSSLVLFVIAALFLGRMLLFGRSTRSK